MNPQILSSPESSENDTNSITHPECGKPRTYSGVAPERCLKISTAILSACLCLSNDDISNSIRAIAAISPSSTTGGRRAVSVSGDETLIVWDLERLLEQGLGPVLATFHCGAPVRCCALVDNRRFVTGDTVGNVHFFALEE